jgi:hypothetical protein
MNDLGPEARSMLAAARGAETITREDRARIKRGVLLRVAVLGAASTTTAGAAAMSVTTKITLTVLTVAALGGGSVSLWAWKGRAPEPPAVARTHSTPRKLAAVAPKAPAVVAEPPAIPPEPQVKLEVKLEAQPEIQRREVIRGASRRPEISGTLAAEIAPVPAPGLAPLDPELTVLRQAQEDLRAGLPAQALRRLTDYDRRFGKGALEEERRAIAAIAFCQVDPGPAAKAQAERFLRTAPESPLGERVRTACQKFADTEK